jgi:tyrosyl-DNA phosphodiesterase 1
MIFTTTLRNEAVLLCRANRTVIKEFPGALKLHRKMADASNEPSRKKRRLGERALRQPKRFQLILCSIDSSVSPPPLRRKTQVPEEPPKVMKSPFQLTRITDLPPALNVDTVSLKDILGDPLISECWEFNYLHNLDFLMDAFDEDIRDLVKVHVIHGFWKQEDASRRNLMVNSSLRLISLYLYKCVVGAQADIFQLRP